VRSLRLLAIILMVAGYAASPLVGRWVSTANASTVPTSRAETAMAPANQDNDNQYEDCGTGNPRKDKKCNYNTPNADNDNGDRNDGSGPIPGNPPGGTIEVSNMDPNRGDTIKFTVIASGTQVDQIWWWVTNYSNRSNGNDNGDDTHLVNGEAHYSGCDGSNYCQQQVQINAGNPGTFTIHAKSRDRQGRESYENAVEVRVH
jgi:hypothetical protein